MRTSKIKIKIPNLNRLREVLRSNETLIDKIPFLNKFIQKEAGFELSIEDLETLTYHSQELEGKVVEEYEIEPPFSRVKIILDPNGTLLYYLITPPLPVDYAEFERIRREVFLEASKITVEPKEEDIFKAFIRVTQKRRIRKFSTEEIGAIWYHLVNHSLRASKITPLLMDKNVEDITCNGYDLPVYVYHAKHGYMRTNVVFERDELDDFVSVVCHRSGIDLTYANPIVDTVLYDGSRINITFRNIVSARGTTFTVRKVKKNPITPTQLVSFGSFNAEAMALFWMAMDYNCSCMFIGATASGKTTSMNATALFIPYSSKIVSIEDTREIVLPHENWTPLVVTLPLVDAFTLVTVTLRQRPEYVIVGEARGKEVTAMFQAMSLGHPCLTTMHAGDAFEIIKRITSPPLEVPVKSVPLLNFIVVVRNIGTRENPLRRCVGAYLVNDQGMGEKVLEDVFVYKFLKYNYIHDTHEVDLKVPFQFLEEKTGKDYNLIERDFEERLNLIRKMVDERVLDAYEFFNSLKEFNRRRLESNLFPIST